MKLYNIRRILPHEDTRASRGDVTRRFKYLHLNIQIGSHLHHGANVCYAVQSILQLSYGLEEFKLKVTYGLINLGVIKDVSRFFSCIVIYIIYSFFTCQSSHTYLSLRACRFGGFFICNRCIIDLSLL